MHAHSLVEFASAIKLYLTSIVCSGFSANGGWALAFRGSLLWVELKAGLGDSCGRLPLGLMSSMFYNSLWSPGERYGWPVME